MNKLAFSSTYILLWWEFISLDKSVGSRTKITWVPNDSLCELEKFVWSYLFLHSVSPSVERWRIIKAFLRLLWGNHMKQLKQYLKPKWQMLTTVSSFEHELTKMSESEQSSEISVNRKNKTTVLHNYRECWYTKEYLRSPHRGLIW